MQLINFSILTIEIIKPKILAHVCDFCHGQQTWRQPWGRSHGNNLGLAQVCQLKNLAQVGRKRRL